jgi:hypothetical protein
MAGEWISQLPGDLQANEAFTQYPTLGDFAKAHLEGTGKLTDTEGKLAELQNEYEGFMENAIVKLPDDATDEQRAAYFQKLGRPEKAEEYEFDREDQNSPEWTSFWKNQFHSLGLTKEQAKALSLGFNDQIQKLVDANNAQTQKEMGEAETRLRNEFGDKYEPNVELAKRLYQKHLGGEFDKEFANGNSQNRFAMIRYLVKLAALTGEDSSPQGNPGANGGRETFIRYDKSPAPPARG